MNGRHSRLVMVGVLALSLSLGLLVGAAGAKKKGKGKGKAATSFTVTSTIVTPIPQGNTPTGQAGFIKVPIGTVGGKKLKGKVVGFNTVEVTSFFTGGAGFANFVAATVIAPNGRTANLINPTTNFGGGMPTETTSGPTTETPNSSTQVCIPIPAAEQPPCPSPDQTLGPPYAGTLGNGALANFAGSAARGVWMVRVSNFSSTIPASLSSITLTATVINAPR